MKKVGETVRYRDDQNRNFTALVVDVHSDVCISLVYCPKRGKVEQVSSVMHRSTLSPAEVTEANVAPPPGRHWIG